MSYYIPDRKTNFFIEPLHLYADDSEYTWLHDSIRVIRGPAVNFISENRQDESMRVERRDIPRLIHFLVKELTPEERNELKEQLE
jgi:hypothetical protein